MHFLLEWTRQRGYATAWGPISLLDKVRTELSERHEAREFDEIFFQRNLSEFGYLSGSQPFEVRSVGVVAVPRPAHLIRFTTESGPVDAPAPPTYLHYQKTAREVVAELNDSAPPTGPHFALLHAPLKALAARLGLVRYGRNNITYVPGLGSYHQLIGVVSDLAPDGLPEPPEAPAVAPECGPCRACQKACPTGAIGGDRFLLHGERCLTYLNESEESWPDWLPPTSHNSVVGCLICQKGCPLNAGLLRFELATEEFTADETAALLRGIGSLDERARLPITEKLTRLGLEWYESVLGRNLKALLEARCSSATWTKSTATKR